MRKMRRRLTSEAGVALIQVGVAILMLTGFDPAWFHAQDRQSGKFEIQIVNLMGFRVEGMQGNAVRGTITASPGELSASHDMVDDATSLVRIIQLIR